MKKTHVISILLFLSILFNSVFAFGASLLGPNNYVRTTGPTNIYETPFLSAAGPARLVVVNGEWDGDRRVDNTVSSASVYLNDELLFGPSSFNKNVAFLESTVTLFEENILRVELNSAPDSFLQIKFTRPSATLEAIPPKILINTESTLNWICYDSVSCNMNQNIGSVDTRGTIQVTPLISTTYTITATDSQGLTASTSSTVTVNNYPDALEQSIQTDEDTQLPIVLSAVDEDNDPLTFSITSQPVNGSLSGTPPILTYTPNENYYGSDSFTFNVNDGMVDSEAAAVSITVNPVNDIPVSSNDLYITDEDVVLITGNVLTNDVDVDGDVLIVDSFTQPVNGVANYNNDGTFTYTPALNYFGSDSFTYTVGDNNGGTDSAVISITVNPVNDAPTVDSETVIIEEDGQTDIIFNGYDVEDDSLTYIIVSSPTKGTLLGDNGDNQIIYAPDPDYYGSDSFTYKVNDGNLESSTETATITITPVNDPPTADSQAIVTDEDNSVVIVLTGTDIEGDLLSFHILVEPINGTLTGISPNITYTPNENFNGTDSLSFQVYDGLLNSGPAIISITVNPINDTPIANGDTVITDEDTPVTYDLLANDTDVDNDTLTIESIIQPANGVAVDNGDGTITYTPNENYNGQDSLSYTINDGNGGTGNATVTITVNSVNDSPIADPQAPSTPEDTTLPMVLTASDVDNDSLEFTILSIPSYGSLSGTAPNMTYTPDKNYFGSDTFTFKVSDGLIDSNIATVDITVDQINDSPVAADDTYSTQEGTSVTTGNVLANDELGDEPTTITVFDATSVNGATVSYNEDGTFDYTPASNFSGSDTFTYTITDNDSEMSTATVTIEVAGVEKCFSAGIISAGGANTVGLQGDGTVVGTGNIFRSGYANVSSWTDIVQVASGVSHIVGLRSDGTVLGTGSSSFGQIDLISWTDIVQIAAADVGSSHTIGVKSDGTVVATGSNNFGQLNVGSWTDIVQVSTGYYHTIGLKADGTVVAVGRDIQRQLNVDSWTDITQVAAGNYLTIGLKSDGTVVATGLNSSGQLNVGSWTDIVQVAAGFSVSIGLKSDGTVVAVGRDQYDFLSANSWTDIVQIAAGGYQVVGLKSDGTVVAVGRNEYGQLDVSTWELATGCQKNYLHAIGDTYSTSVDTSLITGNVLTNDQLGNEPTSITVFDVTSVNGGTVSYNGDGTFNYVPAANFSGSDSFTYTITDNNGETSTATVTIEVAGVNVSPVAVDDNAITDEDTPVIINVLANDTDTNDDTLTIESIIQPANGVAVDNGDGTITYTPNENFNTSVATESFNYVINDGNDGTDTATVLITVNPINDSPVANNSSVTTDENIPINVTLTGNDIDSTLLNYIVIDGPTNGMLAGSPPNLTYTPNASYYGDDSFTFIVNDNIADSAPATISITVIKTSPDIPTINLTAAPQVLSPGEESILTWTTADADSCSIEPNIGAVDCNGSLSVPFTEVNTYTYTFTAEGQGGTAVSEVSIYVTCVSEDYKSLYPSDSVSNSYDKFGHSVAIDGDYAIVGAPAADDNDDIRKGAIYIFKKECTRWIELAKLFASDGEAEDNFGYSVSIDGDYAIVGAPYDDDSGNDSGSAYIFKRDGDTWAEQNKIIGVDTLTADLFGNSVDIDGEYVIVGAVSSDSPGSAYIFKREANYWIEQTRLIPDNSINSSFGNSVSIHNGFAIVGHPLDDTLGDYAGSAYIYKLIDNVWKEHAKLFASDWAAGGSFGLGHSVSIRNGKVIVGAIYDIWGTGSAYIYEQVGDNWIERTKLIASDGNNDDNFGYSVAIDQNNSVIGSINYDSGHYSSGPETGGVYVFSNDDSNWEQTRIFNLYYSNWSHYGYSVDIRNNTVIAGAPDWDQRGYAFIFDIPLVSLSAVPEYTQSGNSSTLVWQVENANNCSLEPGIGAVENIGSYEIIISETTDYILTCSNFFFSNMSSTVTVQLGYPPPGIIFDISNNLINLGESTTLSWAVDNATTCEIEPGLGFVDCNGFIDQSPTETTTYILTATGPGGTLSENLQVTVLQPLTIELLEPNGENNFADSSFEIQWQQTGADQSTTISLYYDLDNVGEDGTLIIGDLTINDLNNNVGSYNWDTSNIPENKYYIYAVISDGLRPPVTSYSDLLYIYHPSCTPASSQFTPPGFAGEFSISGDYAITSGVGYILKRVNGEWIPHSQLVPSDSPSSNSFGYSVAIDGNYAVVGAPLDGGSGNGSYSGAVYIFKLESDEWIQQTKISGLDTSYNDRFGYSVAIDGDYVAVGAAYDDENGTYSGSAYVFKRQETEWIQEAKLIPSDGRSNGFLGTDISISETHIIVGSNPFLAAGVNIRGAAYIFKREGDIWIEQKKLVPSDNDSFNYFGTDVSISGNHAIVGASQDSLFGQNGSGTAYIYELNGSDWVEQIKLTASDASSGDYFGKSVFIEGDYAVIGAHSNPVDYGIYGAVYLFKYDGSSWFEFKKFTPCPPSQNAEISFGGFVFFSDNEIFTLKYTNFIDTNDETTVIESFRIPDVSVSISATPRITPTGETTIHWHSTNADFCKIEPDLGDVETSGSLTQSLTETTTFNIIAYGKNGAASSAVEVVVGAQKIRTSIDVMFYAGFGSSVAIDGDYAIIGAPFTDEFDAPIDLPSDESAGAAYVFKRVGDYWVEQTKLLPRDNAAEVNFGTSVAISGDYIIVGSKDNDGFHYDPYQGAAYIFKREGDEWIEQAKLTAGDYALGSGFGASVAIFEDYAIVADPGQTYLYAPPYYFSGKGAVYVYKREGSQWIEQDRLSILDSQLSMEGGNFGKSVSIHGDFFLTTSSNSNIHIFKREGMQWVEHSILSPDSNENINWDLRLSQFSKIYSDKVVVLGYRIDPETNSSLIQAYLFKLVDGQWIFDTILSPEDDLIYNPYTPSGIAISDEFILFSTTGVYDRDLNEGNLGAVYIFKNINGEWIEQPKITSSDPTIPYDSFGKSLSFSGPYALVGSEGGHDDGMQAGAAYIFPLPATYAEIKADPEVTPTGETTLSWMTVNADSVLIEPNIGEVSNDGELIVIASETTTYQITASGRYGTVSDEVNVIVGAPPPVISLDATPQGILPGQPATISWITSGADSISFDNGIGDVDQTGSVVVSPVVSTTYTMTATGPGGQYSSSITVYVSEVPTASLTVIPISTPYYKGDDFKLSYQTTNAKKITLITNGSSPFLLPLDGGYITKTISVDTTFTLTAAGPGGTATDIVSFNPPDPPPNVKTFHTFPSDNIRQGQSIKLNWNVEHADTVVIDNGIETVATGDSIGGEPVQGYIYVSPLHTTTYTLTATGSGGTTTAEHTLIVFEPPTLTFEASPTEIYKDESTTLTWSSSGTDYCYIEPGTIPISSCDSGSLTVTPLETTTYTFNAVSNLGGATTSEVTVNVIGPVIIDITSPANNETLFAPQATVTGTVTPIDGYVIEEVGISVNGYPAQVNGDTFFVNNVPLAEGENIITVIATLPDGETSTESITVSSDIINSNGWIELNANPESGIAPLDADLRVELHLINNPESTFFTYDGPGLVDVIQTSDFEYDLHFTFSGIYTLSYLAFDDQGNFIDQDIMVNVLESSELDTLLKAKWDGMKASLASGDVEGAVSFFTEGQKDVFREIFTINQSRLGEIATEMQEIELIYMSGDLAEYRIKKNMIYNEQPVDVTFYIYFHKNMDGIWAIRDF